MLYRYGWRNTE